MAYPLAECEPPLYARRRVVVNDTQSVDDIPYFLIRSYAFESDAIKAIAAHYDHYQSICSLVPPALLAVNQHGAQVHSLIEDIWLRKALNTMREQKHTWIQYNLYGSPRPDSAYTTTAASSTPILMSETELVAFKTWANDSLLSLLTVFVKELRSIIDATVTSRFIMPPRDDIPRCTAIMALLFYRAFENKKRLTLIARAHFRCKDFARHISAPAIQWLESQYEGGLILDVFWSHMLNAIMDLDH